MSEPIRYSVAALRSLVAGALLACSLSTGAANAQGTEVVLGSPDSLPEQSSRTPIMYETSYDRDVSSGTWTQSLSYGLTRRRVSFSTNGNYTAIDFTRSPGLGGQSGAIGGELGFRASRNWVLSLNGTFNRVVSQDLVSETSQRQNRLRISSQYNVSPWRGMSLQGVVSSELQQDHGLTVRPLGQERLRLVTRYNAARVPVDTDSIYVHDQRDSTFMSGRQDGASVQMDWKPKSWLQMTTNASGTRVHPTTTSNLRDFGRALDGSPVEVVDRSEFASPNENETYQTKATYSGTRGMVVWINLRELHNNQQYFEKALRNQEHLSIDQRGGIAHAEYAPLVGVQISVDGKIDRSLSRYALRTNRSSLVTSRSLQTSLNYAPSPRSRAGAALSLDRRKNERQETGNGLNISRFLQVNGGYRLSPRIGLDGVGTVSLFSSQYADPVLDQDNLRAYVNVGGGYVVSARCSTLVHFSTARGHTVAIDASRSGNNNVQTTYQVDAALKLGVSPTLSITQNYLLNAVYQIYDNSRAESRNVLSRIRRIDTTIADSVFDLATIQVVHNFLFRDSGSFTKPPGGGAREYNTGSETYQQTLGATLGIKPAAGVRVFVTQSLGNTKTNFPATKTQSVDNRWNLAVGATVERSLMGGATLRGSAQHIGAYTERRRPEDPLNEQGDWIAGVTFHKDF